MTAVLVVKCIVTAVLAIKIHCDSSPSNSAHNRKAGFITLFTVATGRLQTFITFFRLVPYFVTPSPFINNLPLYVIFQALIFFLFPIKITSVNIFLWQTKI